MGAFSADGMVAFRSTMHEVVDSGLVPGVVTLLARGEEVHVDAYGVSDIAAKTPLHEDAIFRIQSMTKPVTAAAAMQMVERGTLSLDDPIDHWVPELANRMVLRTPESELDDVVPAARPITVDHLLTCRSGYGMVFADPDTSPILRAMQECEVDPGPVPRRESSETWLARLAGLPLIHQPGEGWRYHISFDILGILLSRVSGVSLGAYLGENILGPLGMVDTYLFVPDEKIHRLVAAYSHDENRAFVEDEPSGGGHHASTPPFDVSHGELVSTAHDYHRLASMFIRGGELDGVRVLDEASVATMTRDHIDPAQKTGEAFYPGFWDETGWGYGMGITVVRDAYGEPGRYGWMGGYGTAWFNDPATGLTGIGLVQVFSEVIMDVVNPFYRAAFDAME
jgi:CubicO group peptidase (beta-lactamase class C family)